MPRLVRATVSAKKDEQQLKQKDGLARRPFLMEMLYDTMEKKIKGAEEILALAQDKDNLETLAKDEALLEVLSRVMRDDAMNSIELGTAVVGIFFCFSTFSVFHPVRYYSSEVVLTERLHNFRRWFSTALASRASKQ